MLRSEEKEGICRDVTPWRLHAHLLLRRKMEAKSMVRPYARIYSHNCSEENQNSCDLQIRYIMILQSYMLFPAQFEVRTCSTNVLIWCRTEWYGSAENLVYGCPQHTVKLRFELRDIRNLLVSETQGWVIVIA